MSKIKLTKGELKKQRDSLKQFRRYLPTLQLKKQQLQTKILEARKFLNERMEVYADKSSKIGEWAGLLGDKQIDLSAWLKPLKVDVTIVNIAGASVPFFDNIHFHAPEYDFYTTPFWTDKALEDIRAMLTLLAEIEVIKKQIEVLEKELRTTTQRVNLFEKIKIPEAKENIRKIGIYLGDQMANAVGIGKVAKRMVVARDEAALAV